MRSTLRKCTAISSLVVSLAILCFGSVTFGNPGDSFRDSTRLHHSRVRWYMFIAAEMDREHFPDLTESIIEARARNHDIAKRMALKSLRAHGYPGMLDLATIFESFDGENKEHLNPQDRQLFEFAREWTNSIEKAANQVDIEKWASVFSQRKLARIVTQIETLEHIVDLTDTGLFRRGEFGIDDCTPYDGARYLANHDHASSWEVQLSRRLEDRMRDDWLHGIVPHQCNIILSSTVVQILPRAAN